MTMFTSWKPYRNYKQLAYTIHNDKPYKGSYILETCTMHFRLGPTINQFCWLVAWPCRMGCSSLCLKSWLSEQVKRVHSLKQQGCWPGLNGM